MTDDTIDRQGFAHPLMVTTCKNVCRGLDLFTWRSTKESYASKGYCDTAGYFTLFCMQNNQNLKYWAIQIPQNAVQEWCHRDNKGRACKCPPWKIQKDSSYNRVQLLKIEVISHYKFH